MINTRELNISRVRSYNQINNDHKNTARCLVPANRTM